MSTTIHDVVSPLPGTFYAQESPASPPFVTVGSEVGPEDAVGLVEVMKMFTRIPAGVGGTVVEICVESEALVDPGQVLVRIEEKA